jgi:hypothetical protein
MPPSYRPVAPAGGTDPTGSNGGGTTRPGRPLAVKAAVPASSANLGSTTQPPAATDLSVGGSGTRWNQPNSLEEWTHYRNCHIYDG